MGHNFVLLKKDVVMKDFAMTAMKARDNDYIPADTDKVIAYTDLIGGGESTTIEFEAPEKGEYTFLCTFPGHFGLMNGTFIVE
jgi:azurin